MIALGCSKWPWDWDDCIRDGLQTAIQWAFGKFFDFIFQAIASVVVNAVEAVMKAVALLWINIQTPDIAENTPAIWVQQHTNFIMVFIAWDRFGSRVRPKRFFFAPERNLPRAPPPVSR